MTALKWWWKPETLIPSSLATSSIRSGFVEVFAEPLDGLDDAVGGAAQSRDMAEPAALLSHKKPVDDLPHDQLCEEASFGNEGV